MRAHRRRQKVFGPGADRHDEGPHTGTAVRPANWALALSGGGIRSATFCLGVLQELALPSAKAVAGLPPRAQAAYAKVGGLLPQFDYVSSVSGGGFIAGSMQALYVQQPGSPQLAAAAVNRHIAEEPPPGVCSGVTPSPLAWLRENGRYLAPSGAGDMAYAFGFAVRNWFGIQCVIGAPIVLAVALLALAARFLATHWAWLSPEWWWAPLAVLVLWILPTAGAYWMTRSVPDGSAVAQMPWLRIIIVTLAGIMALVAGLPLWLNQMQHLPWQFTAIPNLFDDASQWPMYLTVCGSVLLNTAVWALAMRSDGAQSPIPIHWKPFLKFGAVGLVAIAIGLLLMISEVQERLMSRFPILREVLDDIRPIAAYLALGGALVLMSAFLLWLVEYKRHAPQRSKGELAVSLTHACTMGIQVAIVLLILSLILEVAHELLVTHHPHPILVSGGGAGILALAYRALMKVTPLLRGAGSSLGKNRGIPRRALGVALSALGMVLLLGVAVFWTAAAQWLMASRGSEPWASFTARQQTSFEALAQMTLPSAATLALLALAFVVVAGCWRSILNMSSYCHFYSSRLTRAYLGAANPARTTACGTPAAPQPPTMFAPAPHGVARFVSGDSIAYARYYASEAAPLHLINATLNQTVDPAEQLVQRDRKGKPLVVLPPLSKSGRQPFVDVAIGGIFTRVTGEGADLSIGDWLAVSGAAVSTGMGRQTSAGAAICVTLANARIGRWWAGLTGQDGFWRRALPTYAYLLDEFSARFQGPHRQLLYLTDGGHFENTATYELLRRVRNMDTAVRFIFMCDCGADPEYRYDDLANLVRLARVDFQLEVEVNETVTSSGPLGAVFGSPATMPKADPDHLDTRCAMLLDVREAGVTLARIVMIKPRLISCVSSDLLAYYRNNDTFPQQTTGDQFFDDEQWESYRKLGVECCRAVLNLGPHLWNAIL